MQKIKLLKAALCLFLFSLLWQGANAQNCTEAMQPTITDVVEFTAGDAAMVALGAAPDDNVHVTFDPGCLTRPRGGANSCEWDDDYSLMWYIGFYGQNSPAPNGWELEIGGYAVEGEDDADLGTGGCNIDGVNGLPIKNGFNYTNPSPTAGFDPNICLDVKGSTCIQEEITQNRDDDDDFAIDDFYTFHLWGDESNGLANLENTAGLCDSDINYFYKLCPGQCYNVVIWELILDVPPGSGSNATTVNANPTPDDGPGNGSLMGIDVATNVVNSSIDVMVACGNINILDESPASATFQICMGGVNEPIENPSITIMNRSGICGNEGDTQTYTGTQQWQPEDDSNDGETCDIQDIDVQTVLNDADPTWIGGPAGIDQATGGTGNNMSVGDLSVVTTPGGGGNSKNGDLQLGTNVIEVNCREKINMFFSTPQLGCKGVENFGDGSGIVDLPQEAVAGDMAPCPGVDATFIEALMYITNNGIPVAPNAGGTMAASFCADADYGGADYQVCATNNSLGYPANWTARFGDFVEDSGAYFGGVPGTNCKSNVDGSPFAGAGQSPFDVAGVTTHDFGDGVPRLVSTICIRYEDPCDGSKSATCIKFISDAPISAQVEACQETCFGAEDGSIMLFNVMGGSPDPDRDSDYGTETDNPAEANYVVTIVDSPGGAYNGTALTYQGGSTWVSANNLAPGTYFVDVYDPLAPNDTYDLDTDDTAGVDCNASCPQQFVVDVLPGTITNIVPATSAQGCDAIGTINVSKLSTTELVDDAEFSTTVNDITLNNPEFNNGQNCTTGIFVGTELYENCPYNNITAATVQEVCVTLTDVNFPTTNPSGGPDALFFYLGSTNFQTGNTLALGQCIDASDCVASQSYPTFNATMCFNTAGGDYDPGDGNFRPETPFSQHAGAIADGTWEFGIGNFDCGVYRTNPNPDSTYGGGPDGEGNLPHDNYDPSLQYITIGQVDVTLKLADYFCNEEENITDFCADAGPDNGDGAGNITPVTDAQWTSTDDASLSFVTIDGAGDTEVFFDAQAARDAGETAGTVICYQAQAWVPAEHFNIDADFTDNQGHTPDLGLVRTDDHTCYMGVCCEVVTEMCFVVSDKPNPPTVEDTCSCADATVTPLEATYTCGEISGELSGNAIYQGVFNSPFSSANGAAYLISIENCVGDNATITGGTITIADDGDVCSYNIFAGIPNGTDPTAYPTFSNPDYTAPFVNGICGDGSAAFTHNQAVPFGDSNGTPLTENVGDIWLYLYDSSVSSARLADAVTYTLNYTYPATPPQYNWYGNGAVDTNNDGDGDFTTLGATDTIKVDAATLVFEPTFDATTGALTDDASSFAPTDGMVDVYGNAFDSTTCGTYVFCATVTCHCCESTAFCETYTVNPAATGTNIALGTLCELPDPFVIDLETPNAGETDFIVCTDTDLTTDCVNVTDGMFAPPSTASGDYTFYYATDAACAIVGFTADTECECVSIGAITYSLTVPTDIPTITDDACNCTDEPAIALTADVTCQSQSGTIEGVAEYVPGNQTEIFDDAGNFQENTAFPAFDSPFSRAVGAAYRISIENCVGENSYITGGTVTITDSDGDVCAYNAFAGISNGSDPQPTSFGTPFGNGSYQADFQFPGCGNSPFTYNLPFGAAADQPVAPSGASSNLGDIWLYLYDFEVLRPVQADAITYTLNYEHVPTPSEYTWYGDGAVDTNKDADSDFLTMGAADTVYVDAATVLQTTSTVADFIPSAGDVDVYGNAFDPAVCGNFVFCATATCNCCESTAICQEYTVNPVATGVDVEEEICEGETASIDLSTDNGGATDFLVYTDTGLTALATNGTVNDGTFEPTETAVGGPYMYYYITDPACAFTDFEEDADCTCTDYGTITFTINGPATDPVIDNVAICEGQAAGTFTSDCGANTTWYSDDMATVQVGTGATFTPADVAVGSYTYYATCTSADDCVSNTVAVTYTINPVPVATIDTPVINCNSTMAQLSLNPTDGNATTSGASTGVFSGPGALFIQEGVNINPGGAATINQVNMVPNVPFDLTYTVTSDEGCEHSVTIQIERIIDCAADGGRF